MQQPDGQQLGRAEQLRGQAAAAAALSRSLTPRLAELAGHIAETEDEAARIHDNLEAGPAHLPDAAAHAAWAREFSEHERCEQQRWSGLPA